MDDLRVAWLGEGDSRVGLTLTPGHPTRSAGGAVVSRDIDVDLQRVARDAGRLIVLLTDPEIAAAGLEVLVERGMRMGLHVMRRPVIPRRSVPGWLMTEVSAWRRHGPTVYSDTSGRGRAAVAAAWTLIADGTSVVDAAEAVRAARGPKALAAATDMKRLVEFADHCRESQPASDWLIPLPTEGLRRAHLPPARAPWYWTVSEFALSFDGYAHAGGVDELTALYLRHAACIRATGDLEPGLPLEAARACLFFIQRIWHDRISDPMIGLDPGPTSDELLMAWALVERMRELITRP